MAKKQSASLSMKELCDYFAERNARIFKGEDAKEEEKSVKKTLIEDRIRQRNSRPSLKLQLRPQANQNDTRGKGKLVPTPPPYSSSPRFGRSCNSPLTPRSTSSSSGCYCSFFPSYEQHSPKGSSIISKSQPSSPLVARDSKPGNYHTSRSAPTSPYGPWKVPPTSSSHLPLPCSSNGAFEGSGSFSLSPLSTSNHGYESLCSCPCPRYSSLPSSPRTPTEGQHTRMVRSTPCSPDIIGAVSSQRLCVPHQPPSNRHHLQSASDPRRSPQYFDDDDDDDDDVDDDNDDEGYVYYYAE